VTRDVRREFTPTDCAVRRPVRVARLASMVARGRGTAAYEKVVSKK